MLIRPPVFLKDPKGSNASHNMFRIAIRRSSIMHPLAILLQEFVEWRYIAWFRLMFFGGVGTFGTLLAQGDPVSTGVAWFAAYCAAGAASKLVPDDIRREMEYRGKMCEVVAAVELYGADFETKLLQEATSLLYYDQFEGVSLDTILREMREEEEFARKQFKKHRAFILKFAYLWGEER